MVVPSTGERRQTPRQELRRVARILSGNGAPPYYCLVVNISDGGVRVSTKSNYKVPERFTLSFPGSPDEDGTYKVIWRMGCDVGAMRIKDRESPSGQPSC